MIRRIFQTPSRSRPSPRAGSAAAALLLALAAGCSSPTAGPGPPRLVTADRWIEPGDVAPVESLASWSEEVVFRWDFSDPDELGRWVAKDVGLLFAQSADGVALASAGVDPRLQRVTDFDARNVDVLRLHHSGLLGSYAETYWIRPGDEWLPVRRIRSERETVAGDAAVTDLVVAGHPEWTGTIAGVRIDPIALSRHHIVLAAVEGIRRAPDAQRLAAALGRGWIVEAGGDARESRLAAVGLPVERVVTVPRRQPRLRTAFLAPEAADRWGRGRIVAVTSGRREVLAEVAVDPAMRRWQTIDADLAAFAGQRTRITLEWHSPETIRFSSGLAAWADPRIVGEGVAERPNVVMVVIDTLRVDRTSLHRGGPATTPRLAEWAARRAAVFETAVAPAPWTLPSHASFFSGLDAFRHTANQGDAAPRSLVFLAERLRDAGFATAAFTGGGYLSRAYGLDQGFSRFHALLGVRGPGRSDLEPALRRALPWLRAAPEPFFLLLHTYDVHAPFDVRPGRGDAAGCTHVLPVPVPRGPGDPFLSRNELLCRTAGREDRRLPADSLLARDAYDYGIERTDVRLAGLFDELQALGVDDRTLVIVTSDHGEAFGEHGALSHSDLYDANLLVPLVIAFPQGLATGRRVEPQVRLVDIVPTVLETVGLERAGGLDGRSLRALASGETRRHDREAWSYAASSNRGLSLRVGNRWKLIADNTEFRAERPFDGLFALAPEREELADGDADLVFRLRSRIASRFAAEAQGVRLTARNAANEPLRLTFSGRNANPVTIKNLAFETCGCLTWEGAAARVELAPGRTMELLLERSQGTVLKLRAELAGMAREARVAVAAETAWSLRWEDGRWHDVAGRLPATATGIGLSVAGDAAVIEQAVADRGLREQLRSLGYVD